MRIRPVILSGGAGTRLWPLSRAAYPKQFISITSDRSLFQQCLELLRHDLFLPPLIICNQDHRFIIAEQLRAADAIAERIVLEPKGRNTGPAVVAGALLARNLHRDAIVLVVPSDVLWGQAALFYEAVEAGVAAAEQGYIVTFGIEPRSPETGFGYIHRDEPILASPRCHVARAFVEKPDAVTAAALVGSGEYLWNSGMFLFQVAALLEEAERIRPTLVGALEGAVAGAWGDLDFLRLGEDRFLEAEAISFDTAIMEYASRIAVVPFSGEWSDLGSWSALARIGSRDADGNVLSGDVVTRQASGCYLRSEKPLVAAVGVKDLLVVATDDAVLVADLARSQEIRQLVEDLSTMGRTEHLSHTMVYRPWGHYQELDGGNGFRVKRITVKPGGALSMQRHHHRSEHWIVVRGEARVTRADSVVTLHPNESTYISAGTLHRLENVGALPLELIEVQTGSLLSEDDIERLSDDYGRAPTPTSRRPRGQS